MAYGDIGGAVTELIITCKTPASGSVNISKGDALKLNGAYEITNVTSAEDTVFGQAMADTGQNDDAIPVKVRGISVFTYTGSAPAVDGNQGIAASDTDGHVKAPASGNGKGLNVKVDTADNKVHVLL